MWRFVVCVALVIAGAGCSPERSELFPIGSGDRGLPPDVDARVVPVRDADAQVADADGGLRDVESYYADTGIPEDADAGADVPDVDAGSPPDEPCSRARSELVDGSFEVVRSTIPAGLPRVAGQWAGDLARRTTRTGAMTPHSGASMLRADSSSPSLGGGISEAAQIYQIVRLPAFPGELPLRACARFNRDDSRTPANDRMEVFVWSFSGSVTSFPEAYADTENRVRVSAVDRMDDDPSTWEQLCVQGNIAAGTDYVVLELRFVENMTNREVGEFGRHVMDDACLDFRP